MRQKSRKTFFHFPASSVRTRLTLWYLAVMAFIMILFGGSLYGVGIALNPDTVKGRLATQLAQDTQRIGSAYKQILLNGQPPSRVSTTLPADEVVLLLRPDGTVLDQHGPLTAAEVQQVQDRAHNGPITFDLTSPSSSAASQWKNRWNWWHNDTSDYQMLITPILNGNTRIAMLAVGLSKPFPVPILPIWLLHGFLGLLAAALGGYWLAGKALRPVKMITRTANEINATDLRRRLNFRRRDEFGELAATFDQMLARLEAAFKRQTRFTADASHELRTPLTIINLEINRALTQLTTPAEYRQVLNSIQSENERMTAVVNSLLLLARADTGQTVLHPQEIDLSDIALDSVERLLPLARQSNITLTTGNLPELLIKGDRQYLSRMMLNLVENAIKYTRGIGKHVHIDLSSKQNKWGIIRVKDDGPGIADEHIPYLFERFYRIDEVRSHNKQDEELLPETCAEAAGGTGLGLAIVQWIVQAHGGEVHVTSKIGAGSTFEVYLPLLARQT